MDRGQLAYCRSRLHLWWIAQPEQPALIGDLMLQSDQSRIGFRYSDVWTERGFPLSEDLPLVRGREFLPKELDSAVGAVDDARPDRFTELAIRQFWMDQTLTPLDCLYLAGDNRAGALGVSCSRDQYSPIRALPWPALCRPLNCVEWAEKVVGAARAMAHATDWASYGSRVSGTVPKILGDHDGVPALMKLSFAPGIERARIEHATMTLAGCAGIRVAQTRLVELGGGIGGGLVIRRFDRRAGRRLHAISAKVALRAAGDTIGYPELSLFLRRCGVAQGEVSKAQMRELFRRMVFNILIDNTADHPENQVLLLDDNMQYRLAPAHGLSPAGASRGRQQLRVGEDGDTSTLENALSRSELFALSRHEATAEVRRVARNVARWRTHFAACGVSDAAIASLVEHVERSFLREQREAFV